MNNDKEVRQKYFDVVVTALEAQGWEQAKDCLDVCRWLDHKGRRCAVGHLLPLETIMRYHNADTEQNVELAVFGKLLPQDLLDLDSRERNAQEGYDIHARFVGRMQTVHDRQGHSPEEMREAFKALGHELELTWPLPT